MKELTPEKMAKVLAAKLTDEEFMQLSRLLDGDGPAGPLYCAVTAIAEEKHPEEFVSPEGDKKVVCVSEFGGD